MKYEEVCLMAYESVREVGKRIGEYFRFYNVQRPHQALGYRTPLQLFEQKTEDNVSRSAKGRWNPEKRVVVFPGTVGLALNHQ